MQLLIGETLQDLGNTYKYCEGDSGGPLLHYNKTAGYYKLIGVVSARADAHNDVATFSLFSNHLNWTRLQLNKMKNNTLPVYDSRIDQNLNIPFPESINYSSFFFLALG